MDKNDSHQERKINRTTPFNQFNRCSSLDPLPVITLSCSHSLVISWQSRDILLSSIPLIIGPLLSQEPLSLRLLHPPAGLRALQSQIRLSM